MIRSLAFVVSALFFFIACQRPLTNPNQLAALLQDVPLITGKQEYLHSPFVTAGDRVYMVGHQDGSFPDLGWHIKGEMGGIWDHPIKLMDGFDAELIMGNESFLLEDATAFTNFPFCNKHVFSIDQKNILVERWQFVPDHKEGVVVQFAIHNPSDLRQDVRFKFTGHSDLRPTWLSERLDQFDHPDLARYNNELHAWIVTDSINPWFTIYGAQLDPQETNHEINYRLGQGATSSLSYDFTIPADGNYVLTFIIAGSYHSEHEAISNYSDISTNYIDYFQEKKKRYSRLAHQSRLTIPDIELQNTFEWLKYNCDWLVRTVPEIGTGIGAGIPDYPWWFGVDSEYALKGYMAIGQEDAVYQTIHLLDSLSSITNGNGRIVHEVSTNGVVFNPGNINETPQFASLIWDVYQWNGDRSFLEKYFPTVQKGLDWLLRINDENENLFPDGFGMMEIHGLDSEMIDVASYTQKAFKDASLMAEILGMRDLAKEYDRIQNDLRERINDQFWSDAFDSYADFIGTDQQTLHLIDDAIVRADTLDKPWAVSELQETRQRILDNPSSVARPFVVHHNWVVNTPMEMHIADSAKALRALRTAERFVNPFGVFVTGIDRDASAGSDDGSFKGSKIFSYTGAVMTLPTGVLAVAENNYGRPDKALNYLKRMTRTFSYALPGSMYEVSPDYGMMTQAWNIYSFAIPIVRQFFGINPEASAKRILIQPQMPEAWDHAALENVRVAENEISVFYESTEDSLNIRVNQVNPEWLLEIIVPANNGNKPYDIAPTTTSNELIRDGDKFIFSSRDQEIVISLVSNSN